MNNEILSLKNITKTYPGVRALDNVSLSFRSGEVHALLGENGAGKSTLIKVIAGAVSPDSGSVVIRGVPHEDLTPKKSRDEGIEVIYQEFNLVDSLSAAENIFLGEVTAGLFKKGRIEKAAAELFKQFKVELDPAILVRDLPSSMQQIVEILKAVSKQAEILIMDEPTAPLTMTEVETLFGIIRSAKERGVTIIYISHRLEEIFQISDRVSVMRDGRYIDTLKTGNTSRDELISLEVGRTLSETFPSRKKHSDEVVLELENVTGNGDTDISFQLHKGEILGLAGLVGAGRSELVRVIYGAEHMESGSVFVNGEIRHIKSPADAMKAGIGLIPENRKEEGCFLDQEIGWNIVINTVKSLSRWMIFNRKKGEEYAGNFRERLDIKTPSLKQKVKNLSGGNQQKVVIAKTLAAQTQILIFDEPTRGIDVGAKKEIYQLMCDLVESGHSILMISSEMEELLGMSDRIIVLTEGHMAGEILREDFSQQRVLELASQQVN